MTFIQTILEDQAEAGVKEMYEENIAQFGYLPNYVRAFGLRPHVMAAWGQLLGAIHHDMDPRRYELVTLAAARALKSSYCMLAHVTVVLNEFYSTEQLTQIARDYHAADLTRAEVAMMAFAEQVVLDATAVTQTDIDVLRRHNFTDAEIFDITAAAAARCFLSKTVDALGAEPDKAFMALDEELRGALTVGRRISRQILEE